MKLSVIVIAYNRSDLTARHVEECLKSTRVPDEIIVVNDGGDKALKEMLPKGKGITYAYITPDILWNYNGAVNLGFWIASGDIVAIEDTDHMPMRDTYQKAVEFFEKEENKSIERLAFSRNVVEQSELVKPMEEWTISRNWGPNDMVSVVRRSMYIRMKGQDERFARNYGYMCYCYKARMRILNIQSSKIHGYWAIVGDGGEPNMKRGLSAANRSIYHDNANRPERDGQFKDGILNFNFTIETL